MPRVNDCLHYLLTSSWTPLARYFTTYYVIDPRYQTCFNSIETRVEICGITLAPRILGAGAGRQYPTGSLMNSAPIKLRVHSFSLVKLLSAVPQAWISGNDLEKPLHYSIFRITLLLFLSGSNRALEMLNMYH